MKELTGIIKNVTAQSADSISLPTFVTDIDFQDQTNNGGNNGGSNTAVGKLELTTQSTTFNVGTNFSVDILMDTDDTAIQSFTVSIKYSNNVFQAKDGDTNSTGVQVGVAENSGFVITENTVVGSQGVITLKGERTTAAAFNGKIATIDFQVIASGTGKIEIVEAESSFVDNTSTNVLEEVDELSITIGTGQSGNPTTPTTPVINPPTNPTGGLTDLPKSDLPGGGIIYMLIGVIFIGLGLHGRRIANRTKNQNK